MGARIAALLERRGWSQNKLAERSGVDKSQLSKLIRGRSPNPGHGTIRKLADALGVELSELTGERPMPRRRAEVFEGVAMVPVMRVRVQASGGPIWDDTRESVPVSLNVAAGRPNIRAAVVTGECMAESAPAGARVVFDPDATPQDRQMVVVTTDEGATLVKWYRIDLLGRPFLRADDGTEMRPNGAKIEGVVLAVVRQDLRDTAP
jgi:DNA-binding Xre family transcriptional regulator